MEYLSKAIVQDTPFVIQDFNLQTDYVAIANNGVLAIDFSFIGLLSSFGLRLGSGYFGGGIDESILNRINSAGKSAYKAISTVYYKYGISSALTSTINLWKNRFVNSVNNFVVSIVEKNLLNLTISNIISSTFISFVEWIF